MGIAMKSKTLKRKTPNSYGSKNIEYEVAEKMGGGAAFVILHCPMLSEIKRVAKVEFPSAKLNQLQITKSGDVSDGIMVTHVNDKYKPPARDWFEE